MSFLTELLNKRKQLRMTETIVTHADGKRFLESSNTSVNCQLADNPFGFVVDNKPDDVPAFVIDCLYLGSQDCCQLHVLEAYNIQSVLSVGIKPFCKSPNVQYVFVDCYDLPESNIISVLLKECIPFISQSLKERKNILVHCNAGVSRSAAIVIGYLMYIKKYTYDEAYNIIKITRSCARPNIGFEKQLKDFQKTLS